MIPTSPSELYILMEQPLCINWDIVKALQDCLRNKQHTYFVLLSFLFCLSYIVKINFFFFCKKVGVASRGSRQRYAPGAPLFWQPWVRTQIRCCRLGCLIKVYTVFIKKWKSSPDTTKPRNGLIQLIKMEESIGIYGLIRFFGQCFNTLGICLRKQYMANFHVCEVDQHLITCWRKNIQN